MKKPAWRRDKYIDMFYFVFQHCYESHIFISVFVIRFFPQEPNEVADFAFIVV